MHGWKREERGTLEKGGKKKGREVDRKREGKRGRKEEWGGKQTA